MITEITAPTVITEATHLTGSLRLLSYASLHGTIEGDVEQKTPETLHIGQTAWVRGKIDAQGTVRIEGRVEGDVYSSTRISLASTAHVTGRLLAPKIEVAAGASMEGSMQTSPPPAQNGMNYALASLAEAA